MRRLLYVVDRGRPDIFSKLRAEFEEDGPNVSIIIDRRVGERRRGRDFAEDRRCGERRRYGAELQPLGWALIPLTG